MFKKIYQTLSERQKKFYFFILFLIFINAVFETIGLASIVPLLNLFINDDFINHFPYLSDLLLNFSKILLPESIYENNSIKNNFIIAGLIFFTLIFLIKTIFYIFLIYMQTNLKNNVIQSISHKLYSGYLGLDYIFHTMRNSSNLKQNIIEETNLFSTVFNSILIIITEFIILIFISLFLIFYSPELSIIIVTFLIVVAYIILKLTKKKITQWGSQRLFHMEARLKILEEGLYSMKEIYILQKSMYFLNNFNNSLKNFLIAKRNYTVILHATRPTFEFVGVLSLIIMLLVVVFKGNSTTYVVTTLGVFLAASYRLLPSLYKIIQNIQDVKFHGASIDRILKEFKIINTQNKLVKNKTNIKFEENITFSNVDFVYPNKNLPALNNINFSIKRGSKIGIKGASGAGKSTLINLILTLTTPTKGEIKVDNVNLEQNNLSWLKNIGYVPQDVNLIDDTIEKNIAFGLEKEEIEVKKLTHAINSAQLSKFIDDLKDGARTKVGEKGAIISGGQKQRIGIARALYNNPNLIILDESTSALDLETERLIMDIIYNLGQNITIIIVSHRQSALSGCDKIINISNTKAIEEKIKNV